MLCVNLKGFKGHINRSDSHLLMYEKVNSVSVIILEIPNVFIQRAWLLKCLKTFKNFISQTNSLCAWYSAVQLVIRCFSFLCTIKSWIEMQGTIVQVCQLCPPIYTMVWKLVRYISILTDVVWTSFVLQTETRHSAVTFFFSVSSSLPAYCISASSPLLQIHTLSFGSSLISSEDWLQAKT